MRAGIICLTLLLSKTPLPISDLPNWIRRLIEWAINDAESPMQAEAGMHIVASILNKRVDGEPCLLYHEDGLSLNILGHYSHGKLLAGRVLSCLVFDFDHQ